MIITWIIITQYYWYEKNNNNNNNNKKKKKKKSNPVWFKAIQTNEGESDGNWVVIFNRLKKIYSLLSGYYAEELGQSVVEIESPNFNLISKNKDKREIVKFAQLILVLAVQSEKNREYIQKITSLNQANQQWIMISIEEVYLYI